MLQSPRGRWRNRAGDRELNQRPAPDLSPGSGTETQISEPLEKTGPGTWGIFLRAKLTCRVPLPRWHRHSRDQGGGRINHILRSHGVVSSPTCPHAYGPSQLHPQTALTHCWCLLCSVPLEAVSVQEVTGCSDLRLFSSALEGRGVAPRRLPHLLSSRLMPSEMALQSRSPSAPNTSPVGNSRSLLPGPDPAGGLAEKHPSQSGELNLTAPWEQRQRQVLLWEGRVSCRMAVAS